MSAEDESELDDQIEPTEEVEETPDETAEGTPVVEHTEFEKKQYERAKTAEAEVKVLKAKLADKEKAEAKVDTPSTNAETLSTEEFAKEVRLLATLSDEEIAEARDISKGKDIPLEKALKTKAFLAFQKELKDEQRKEKAKLGSSKGSQVQQETEIGSLPRDEHKEKVKEMMAEIK